MTNQDYDDLIHKFLLGMANEDDKRKILPWINSNPANRQYFVQVRDAWLRTQQQVDSNAVDLDAEWLDLQQSFPSLMKTVHPYNEGPNEAGQDYNEKVSEKKRLVIKRLAIVASVAAAFYLLLVYPLNVFFTTTPKITKIAKDDTRSVAPSVNRFTNTTGREMKIRLPDGSRVVMKDRCEISYGSNYNFGARNVRLLGDAEFSVVRDSSKPFKVLTEYIATTALGTRFQVKSMPAGHLDFVKLFEGKVVVEGLSGNSKIKRFLKPGDELIFNRKNLTARVIPFRKKRNTDRETIAAEVVSAPSDYKGNWFMFNNEPLERVFQQLERVYAVKIKYEKKDLSNIFFVGKFDLNDPIENIIKRISLVNHLKYTVEKDTFIISK